MNNETEKFRMLFYRPAIDGKWIDNAIAGWTRLWNLDCPKELICSHQEIWLPDKDRKFLISYWENTQTGKVDTAYLSGYCWTSTMGQIRNKGAKYNGVCCRPAQEVLYNPDRWFYCEFEICLEAYNRMISSMLNELLANKGYDISMLLNFFLPVGIGRKDKWICSEFSNHHAKIGLSCRDCSTHRNIYEALKDTYSPMRTAKILNKIGVKFFNLNKNEKI
jgi:hypothetical protein